MRIPELESKDLSDFTLAEARVKSCFQRMFEGIQIISTKEVDSDGDLCTIICEAVIDGDPKTIRVETSDWRTVNRKLGEIQRAWYHSQVGAIHFLVFYLGDKRDLEKLSEAARFANFILSELDHKRFNVAILCEDENKSPVLLDYVSFKEEWFEPNATFNV